MTKGKLRKIWQQVPVDYYQRGINKNIFQRLWHQTKINSAQKIIRNLSFKNCLDIGCASGYMTAEIARCYPRAQFYGIDVYKEAIRFGKLLYPHISFKVASSDQLPFTNRSFDLIICYETIEHVRKPQKLLEEARRVLKKDGRFILAMDSGNLVFKLIWLVWRLTYGRVWTEAHLHPFHHQELEQLIKVSRFKIAKKEFTHLSCEIVFVLKKSNS